MKTLNVGPQGSPQWHAARAWPRRCASEAAMALGTDKRTSRNDGVRMKASGDDKEFSAWVQENLLNRGHEVEKFGVEFAQRIIGEELFPETATDDSGQYLASFDGISMDSRKACEVKLWNESLADLVRQGELPNTHSPQIAGQFIVGDELEEIIFVVTDGTEDRTAFLVCQRADFKTLMASVRAAWDQFTADVDGYQHVEYIPAPTGTSGMTALPALRVSATGQVTESNFDEYKTMAMAMIGAIKTELITDKDFADADETVKACVKAEADIATLKRAVLSGMTDVTRILDGLDELDAAISGKRNLLKNTIKERKDKRRDEIRMSGVTAFAKHISELNKRVGMPMPNVGADFAGVLRGLKTIKSQQNAVDTELARAKIAANEIADRMQCNLAVLNTFDAPTRALFADAASIALKAPEDFALLVESRITAHKAAEKAKEEALAAKIRAEEAARQAAQAAPPPPATPAIAPVAAQPAPIIAPPAWGVPKKVQRPTDGAIIRAVAQAFGVDDETAVDWISAMDFSDMAA